MLASFAVEAEKVGLNAESAFRRHVFFLKYQESIGIQSLALSNTSQ